VGRGWRILHNNELIVIEWRRMRGREI
jgi:hypothetical protein